MKTPNVSRVTLRIVALVWVSLLASVFLTCSDTDGSSADSDAATVESDASENPLPWIDTHAHPTGIESDCTSQTCVDAVIETMDAYGVRRTILLAPPAPAGGLSTEAEAAIRTTVAMSPDRFYYGAGGNQLNAMIHQTPESGTVSEQMRQDFQQTATELMNGTDAVVFGETAVLHLSYSNEHAFEEIDADTPLFGLLADLAVANNVPIDLHMDAVQQTLDTPGFYTSQSDRNPAQVQENITGLEALLESNRDARIVWVHVGRDTTGQQTAELVDGLLENHANLYIQVHPIFGPLGSPNAMVDRDGVIRTEWLEVLEDYPDRVVLGSDTFYTGTADDGTHLAPFQTFLQQLPGTLATQFGCENPIRIYNLSGGC